MIQNILIGAAYLGLFWMLFRLWPRSQGRAPLRDAVVSQSEVVSIIIPARNEAANLPLLLKSLQNLVHGKIEVIVVDDHSEDQTPEIAKSFGAKVVTPGARPAEWLGKSWACFEGAREATGQYLLFLDADTELYRDSISRALSFMAQTKADLISPLYFHRCPTWWEKLLGPGFFFMIAGTAPYEKPRPHRLYAIGQFLLFRAEYYREFGGHEAVKSQVAEDLALAHMCLQANKNYRVYAGSPIYKVRMYSNFKDFVAGWRRSFRFIYRHASPLAIGEVLLMFLALTGGGFFFGTLLSAIVTASTMLFVGAWQRRLGEFSPLGVLLWPFAFIVMVTISLLSLYDAFAKKDVLWKGRRIADTTGRTF